MLEYNSQSVLFKLMLHLDLNCSLDSKLCYKYILAKEYASIALFDFTRKLGGSSTSPAVCHHVSDKLCIVIVTEEVTSNFRYSKVFLFRL